MPPYTHANEAHTPPNMNVNTICCRRRETQDYFIQNLRHILLA